MAVVLVAAGLCGCDTVGPTAINLGRTSYNSAIQRTDKEQMLLNLIRIRYGDTLAFLQVNQASSSIEIDMTGNLGGTFGNKTNGHHNAFNVMSLSGSSTYSEHPVITYIPLQGENFANQLMVPTDLKSLLLLCQSDWPVDQVLRICVQRIGTLLNFPPAMKTEDAASEKRYMKFLRLATILREFQTMGRLNMGICTEHIGPDKSQAQMSAIRIDIDDTQTGEKENQLVAGLLTEMRNILGLDETSRSLVLTNDVNPSEKGRYTTVTRSVMSSMFYASHGIIIPDDDRPKVERTAATQPASKLDWQPLMSKLISIRYSSLPPSSAYVTVPYNGKWFYIDENDVYSKSTFVLLTQLFQIRAVGSSQGGMLLSLPIK